MRNALAVKGVTRANRTRVNVSLLPDTFRKVRDEAYLLGVPLSQVMEAAIMEYVDGKA